MENIKQIVFNEYNCDLMFLCPYVEVFYAGDNKYIYYRSDLHTYIQLILNPETHNALRQSLKKGMEQFKLKDFFASLGVQDSDILISKLICAGVIE